MKSAEELQVIAQNIEYILEKLENQTFLNQKEKLLLAAELKKAGTQYLDLPFKIDPLSIAAQRGNIPLLELLKPYYADFYTVIRQRCIFNMNKLQRIVSAIHATAEKTALHILPSYLSLKGDPFLIACQTKNEVLMRLLLGAYVKISTVTDSLIYDSIIAGIEAIQETRPDVFAIFYEFPDILKLKKSSSPLPVGLVLAFRRSSFPNTQDPKKADSTEQKGCDAEDTDLLFNLEITDPLQEYSEPKLDTTLVPCENEGQREKPAAAHPNLSQDIPGTSTKTQEPAVLKTPPPSEQNRLYTSSHKHKAATRSGSYATAGFGSALAALAIFTILSYTYAGTEKANQMFVDIAMSLWTGLFCQDGHPGNMATPVATMLTLSAVSISGGSAFIGSRVKKP